MKDRISYKKFIIDVAICETEFTISIRYGDGELVAQTKAGQGELKKMVEWARKKIDIHIRNKAELEREMNELELDWAEEKEVAF